MVECLKHMPAGQFHDRDREHEQYERPEHPGDPDVPGATARMKLVLPEERSIQIQTGHPEIQSLPERSAASTASAPNEKNK